MTERVYLHVGAPKSGTTYLQKVLETNRDRLGAAGFLVVGDRHVDRVHAAMVIREDPRLEGLPAAAARSWSRLVEQIRAWQGPSAILSYELLAGASAQQVSAALADLGGLEVHVVITCRDFGRALPSAWQERLKFALTKPLEKWAPPPESAGPRAEWGWRTMDPAGVAARWGSTLSAEQVHVVTVPREGAGHDELWQRFASACRIDVPDLALTFDRANESMGVATAELLRLVNEQVGDSIVGNREHARWLRDTLAHQVLGTLDREPIGLTDEQYADASARSEAAMSAVRSQGYAVHGDLEDLRATRPSARTPGEVSDKELLDKAVVTIVRLLVMVRERTMQLENPSRSEAPRQSSAGHGPKRKLMAAGRVLVQKASSPHALKENERLQARLDEVERELESSRRLQLRMAEVTDMVQELLLPHQQRDHPGMARSLKMYRKDSL